MIQNQSADISPTKAQLNDPGMLQMLYPKITAIIKAALLVIELAAIRLCTSFMLKSPQ